MNLPALVHFSQQDVYNSLTILGCTVNCRFQFADCPLIHSNCSGDGVNVAKIIHYINIELIKVFTANYIMSVFTLIPSVFY